MSDQAGPPLGTRGHWIDQLRHTSTATGLYIASRPAWVVATVLVAVSLLKCGFVVWNWFELSPFLLTDWNGPASAFQSNVLLNAVATGWRDLGLDPTSFVWLVTQAVVTILVFAAICVLVVRRTDLAGTYLPLALVLSSGLAAVLWREIGRYDALFLLGVFLALLARRSWLVWLGVAIAASSSPEQLLVGSVLLVLLSVLPLFRDWRAASIRLLAGAVVVLVAVQLWFVFLGNPYKTRIGTLLEHVTGHQIAAASAYDTKQGFVKFTIEKAMVTLSAGPSLVWSYLGVSALLLVLFVVIQRSWAKSVYLALVVIAIPVLASFVVGEDRTRDLVLICAPIIIAMIMVGSSRLGELMAELPGDTRVWLNWLALLVALVPLTYFYLYAEEPFRFLKELVIALNNGVPFEMDGSTR